MLQTGKRSRSHVNNLSFAILPEVENHRKDHQFRIRVRFSRHERYRFCVAGRGFVRARNGFPAGLKRKEPRHEPHRTLYATEHPILPTTSSSADTTTVLDNMGMSRSVPSASRASEDLNGHTVLPEDYDAQTEGKFAPLHACSTLTC